MISHKHHADIKTKLCHGLRYTLLSFKLILGCVKVTLIACNAKDLLHGHFDIRLVFNFTLGSLDPFNS